MELGIPCHGVRLDSGDLGALSLQAKEMFAIAAEISGFPVMKDIPVVASNDINENALLQLSARGHAISVFGIGE